MTNITSYVPVYNSYVSVFDMGGYEISPSLISHKGLNFYILSKPVLIASNNYSFRLLFVLNQIWVSGLWKTHCSFPLCDSKNVGIH
jgi:hypothetical protein